MNISSEIFLNHLVEWTRTIKLTEDDFLNKENSPIFSIINSLFSLEKIIDPSTRRISDISINIHIGHTLLSFIKKYGLKAYTLVGKLILYITERLTHLLKINITNVSDTGFLYISEIGFSLTFSLEQINTMNNDMISMQDINDMRFILKDTIHLIIEHMLPYSMSIKFSTTLFTPEDQMLNYILMEGVDYGINTIEDKHIELLTLYFNNPDDKTHNHDRLKWIFDCVYNYIINTYQHNSIDEIKINLGDIFFNTDELTYIFNITNMFNFKYSVFTNSIQLGSNNEYIVSILQKTQSNFIAHRLNTHIIPSNDCDIFDQVVLDFSNAIVNSSNINNLTRIILDAPNLKYIFLPVIIFSKNDTIKYVYDIYNLIMVLIKKTLGSEMPIDEFKKSYDENTVYNTSVEIQRLFDIKETLSFTNGQQHKENIIFTKNIVPISQLHRNLIWMLSKNIQNDLNNATSIIGNIILETFIKDYTFMVSLGYPPSKESIDIIESKSKIRYVFKLMSDIYRIYGNKELYITKQYSFYTKREEDIYNNPYIPIYNNIYNFELK